MRGALRNVLIAVLLMYTAAAPAGEADWKREVDEGRAAARRGDNTAATAHYRRALQEAERFGEGDWRLAVTVNNLAAALREDGLYAQAEPFYLRAIRLLERIYGPRDSNVGIAVSNVAGLYEIQGRYAEAEASYQRALAIHEASSGPDQSSVGITAHNLGLLYTEQGRNREAEALFRRTLSIFEKTFGSEHSNVAVALASLGSLYASQGRYGEAQALYERSVRIQERNLGATHPGLARVLALLGRAHYARGDFAAAEAVYLRIIRDNQLQADHPDWGGILGALASVYQAQGRYGDAEPLYQRSLSIFEKAHGPDHRSVAIALGNLANLRRDQSKHAEAEPLFRRALEIARRQHGTEHPNVVIALNNLGKVYAAMGRQADAEPLLASSVSIGERVLGPQNGDLGRIFANLGEALQSLGRHAGAETLFRRSLAITEKAFGPDHPAMADSLYKLAGLYKATNRPDQALDAARRATGIVARRSLARDSAGGRGASGDHRARGSQLGQHVALLHIHGEAHPAERNSTAAEAFRVAQIARASETAEQVARMAARFAGGNDALGRLARERQDTAARAQANEALLVRLVSKPQSQRALQAEEAARTEQAMLERQLSALDQRMAGEFPQYAELSAAEPLEMEAARKLLGRGEALVVFFVLPEETFVWALNSETAQFERLAVKSAELDALVRGLRKHLDLGDAESAALTAPFDAEAAHAAYRRLLAPVERVLGGRSHLIVVADGSLQSLPLGMLVTGRAQKTLPSLAQLAALPAQRSLKIVAGMAERPGERNAESAAPAAYADVAWLIKSHAISVLPAVSSLRALRVHVRAAAGAAPLAGFGDPLLEGSGPAARSASLSSIFARGGVADPNEVRKLERLPETADELRSIAATLKSSEADLYLGAAATETRLKQIDLTRFRHIAFATHGLMAGDLKTIGEPALVLTPPARASEQDDGLVTASEIAQLKLNADWIILSACNTAASDGTPGAEGLSGLSKAFFHAGARSLLVSHWAVSSHASVALTTRMFEEAARGVSKAEALRRSMLALMQRSDNPYFAHPAFWGPFIVVGEGNHAWAAGK